MCCTGCWTAWTRPTWPAWREPPPARALLTARPNAKHDALVIGAGLSGLAAAWWLGQQHSVTLFERQAQPGFTAANVAVPGRGAAGNPVRVDVPLRVFYPGYYPTLTRLYAALGVPSEPVSYAASFHGPAFYGLPRNTGTVTLKREAWTLPETLPFGDAQAAEFVATLEAVVTARSSLLPAAGSGTHITR